MADSLGASIMEQFASLEDPRVERTKRHKLLDIVAIAICGTICGADSWVDIELFGNCKGEWFKTFLELPEREQLLLCDAQTSGGLLISVPAERKEALLSELHAAGVTVVAVVGEITEGPAGQIQVVP